MLLRKTVLTLIGITSIFACQTEKKNSSTIVSDNVEVVDEIYQPSKVQIILDETIKAHGGDLYDSAHYSFVFRGNTYRFKNDGVNFKYQKNVTKGQNVIIDQLKNTVFSRTVNGEVVTLSNKRIDGATGAINSVIYFATLPHKLNDKAVNKTCVGETTIKNKDYSILEITFKQEGGGEDHDDEFYYWINKTTKKIDYLAYNYKVNEGGVRFRSAYNSRVVDGVTFQDYINYKADVGTPLKELPALFEAGQLKELSRIKTENIINLNTK